MDHQSPDVSLPEGDRRAPAAQRGERGGSKLRGRLAPWWIALVAAGCALAGPWYEPVPPRAQDSRPADATLFLLGDAGAASPSRDLVLTHLSAEIERSASGGAPVVVAYLGDNIYEVGARPSHAAEDRAKLSAQIEAVGRRGNVRTYFLPGNHDWGGGGAPEAGLEAVRLQALWVEELADGRDVTLLPARGCAGPAVLDVDSAVRLVVIDTEALIRDAPGPCGSADDVYRGVETALRDAGTRPSVVLAHHPVATGGKHGGDVRPLARVPILSFLAGRAGVERQDVTSAAYAEMIERLRTAFAASGAPPIAVAGGHEHSLQVIRLAGDGPPTYQLVSGSVAKSSRVRPIPGTRYAISAPGYMRLELRGSEVRLTVFGRPAARQPLQPLFGCALAGGALDADCPAAPRLSDR